MLESLGIIYSHNRSKHIISVDNNQIICRSMDNPSRIVAYEVYASHVDEVDLMHTAKKGHDAWNRIVARNRQRHPNKDEHFNMVSAYSTPESYNFTYQRWKKEPGDGYKYIVAPTKSNPFLDSSYIDQLKDTYTPEQQTAYLEGIWTNIATGSVYSYYDRDKNNTNRVLTKKEPIMIGADFNYGGSCAAIYVPLTRFDVTKDKSTMTTREINAAKTEMVGLQLVDEFAAMDTEEMAVTLKTDYSGHNITMFPDATGTRGSSNAAPSDIAILKQAGFVISAKRTNPRIVDRINAVQRLLYNGLFKVNYLKAPKTSAAMEEQAYSEITGLPEKAAGPATIDDRNDAMGYCPAYLFPIKKITSTRKEL